MSMFNENSEQKERAEWKKIGMILLVYFVIFFGGTLLFLSMFHISFLNPSDVFFYRGCVFLVVCSSIVFVLMLFAGKVFRSLHLTVKDAILMSGLFWGITLGWFTLVPTTVERSISVFMLSYMDESPSEEGITIEEFGDVFFDKYIHEFGAFEKRFHEQEVSGNIAIAPNRKDGYVITDNGRFMVGLFRLFSRLFGTEEWLVYPNEY